MTEPGFIDFTISSVTRTGRALAGDERRADDDVGLRDVRGDGLRLLLLVLLGQLLRVAAGRLRVLGRSTSTNFAPRLSTCSLTTLRTSNASTTAPRRRAVPMA